MITHSAPLVTTQSSCAILLPTAVDKPFTYKTPEDVAAGALVMAKLMGRTLVGAVWEDTHQPIPEHKLKAIDAVLDFPPLSKRYRDWIDWVAEFTLAPKGAVLALAALSYAAKKTRKAYVAPEYNITLPTLTSAQKEAATAIEEWCAARGARREGEKPISAATLLDGVTGSGKTEVYFHAIAKILETTRHYEGQVLVLLPEIALTHQWFERFCKTFGAPPTVWHSQETPAARTRVWQAVARGEARVVVGARSALFLPFKNLQLIIVDEEHDPTYKQDDGVLYHARDMAVARAKFEGIPIVLASATPSIETLHNVREGRYRRLHLPERYGAAGLPQVQLLDLLQTPPARGEFLSPPVKEKMLETLARGEQTLLFLNRRGYAPLLLCRGCGHRFECPHCSAWLVVHGKAGLGIGDWGLGNARLHCHHCDHREPLPNQCPKCEAKQEKLAPCGPGVERIAEEVRHLVASPESLVVSTDESHDSRLTTHDSARIAILSSDEAVAAETWAEIERGNIDILIGTQMAAKGHHFPKLTLVAMVDADLGLDGADLRASERAFQLLHQLSGRAGREGKRGEVLVQTTQPNHPVMQALRTQDREAIIALELAARRAGNWPPFGQLAAILLDGANEASVRRAGQLLAQTAPKDERITILGPAPAPLSRLRDQYRYRLLVKAHKGIHLQRTLSAWLAGKKFSGVRVKVDVNPYYFQ